MTDNKLCFELKPVTVLEVKNVMSKMKKKKSAGPDEISQECLLIGKRILAAPLTKIINTSITQGMVPDSWKEATVIPILKKGNPQEKENYRPVSILIAASKVLEKIVCSQVTDFLEENKLLPKSQHGFRKLRSTMSAHTNMQQDWILSSPVPA